MALINEDKTERAFQPTAILYYTYISYLVLLYSGPLIVKFSLTCNFEKQTTNSKDLAPTLIFTIRDISSDIVNGSNYYQVLNQ